MGKKVLLRISNYNALNTFCFSILQMGNTNLILLVKKTNPLNIINYNLEIEQYVQSVIQCIHLQAVMAISCRNYQLKIVDLEW